MVQCIAKAAGKAISPPGEIEAHVNALLAWLRPRLIELVQSLYQERTPSSFLAWEFALLSLLREFGRLTLERLLNGLEGDGAHLPPDVVYLGQGYRRLRRRLAMLTCRRYSARSCCIGSRTDSG